MRITDGGTPVVPPQAQPVTPKPESSPSSVPQSSPYDLGSRVNLRGVAITNQSYASVSRTSEDFELGRITSVNFVSRDTEITATRSSSLKVTTASSSEAPRPEGENTGDDPNVFLSKTNLQLAGVQGYANASVASVKFSNRQASLTVSALGAEASGQASLGITHDGITAQASGNAEAYLADAKATLRAGPTEVSADASVGAGVNGNARVAFNPLKGDIGADTGVSAFAGAQANETGNLTLDGTTASETANVGAGVGVDAKVDMGIDEGKVDVNFDMGAYLGVGAGVDVAFSVNAPKLAESAWHDITSIF